MSTILSFARRSMVVADPVMEETVYHAEKAAKTYAPVLLCGESGTGKELFARYIHERSPRAKGPFVSVNCAAVPEGLMEAEFFGYERGAFTGAINRRIGKFEMAQGGTLLLDEVSEMPIHLQAKLLRVLQEGEIDRIGGKEPIYINCRIIATTNRDPLQLISSGAFREDLFFRLNVFRIECMPLRNRPRAIATLAESFIEQLSQSYALEKPPKIHSDAMKKLCQYSWPGNIRELRNAIERAVLLCEEGVIRDKDLDTLVAPVRTTSTSGSLADMERKMIQDTLEKTEGNRKRAAEELGITARTLRNKLKLYA